MTQPAHPAPAPAPVPPQAPPRASPSNANHVGEVVGAVLMVLGVGVAIVSYVFAGNQNSGDLAIDNLEHNEHLLIALIGVATTVVGAAVFLRFGLARTLQPPHHVEPGDPVS